MHTWRKRLGKNNGAVGGGRRKRAYSGKVKIFEKAIEKYKGGELYRGVVSLLPQDIEPIFLKDTVAEELKSVDRDGYDFLTLDSSLLSRHPYDFRAVSSRFWAC